MKAKDFVLSKYPNATAFPMIDNENMQTSYVIIKDYKQGLEIFPNEAAETASKAWTNARRNIENNTE